MKHSYVLSLVIFLSTVQPAQPATSSVVHYEYVFVDGQFYAYDLDHNFALVKASASPPPARGEQLRALRPTRFLSAGIL